MLRSLWLLLVYTSFLGLGTQAPFVLVLGYVWVDTFRPQDVSYVILNQVPVAMVMGVCAVTAYVMADRRSPPRPNFITFAHLMLAFWVTMTMIWAVSPGLAWAKWDWAFKTLLFAAFIPYVIRSRVQIEAFIQVYVFSLAANLLPFGAKIALSGGGYGRDLGLGGGNTGLGEGATLAAVAAMTIPLAFFLWKHAQLMPKLFLFKLAYLGIAAAALLTAIGSFQRTGMVAILVLGIATFFKSKHKLLVGIFALLVAGAIFYLTSDAWTARIKTIGEYEQDTSAMTRILVWRWTLDYVMSHPLGGGFNMYVINAINHAASAAHPGGWTEFGRAFHSIYFEVLGEHGWIGFGLYVGMLIYAQISLQRAGRRVRGIPELEWCRDLAANVQISLAILTVCGAFIGIAFQPMIHYMLAISVSISEYVRRSVQAEKPAEGWRARGAAMASRPAPPPATATRPESIVRRQLP